MAGKTDHATRFDKIELLTDQVLNWYQFDHASDWRMRPHAMIVAIRLHDLGVFTDTNTGPMIELADAESGGQMAAMHAACSYPARTR